MKKHLLWAGIIIALLLAGCGKDDDNNISNELGSYTVQNSQAEVSKGDFIYRLISEKEEYLDKDEVKLYAELEYIGDQEEITIYHAMSPFYFPLEEKIRGIKIDYPMPEPLIIRKLVKGQPLREEYNGSGAYSPEDDKEYVEFMEDFIENGFPPGYYLVNGSADFMIGPEDQEKEKILLQAQIDFKVN